MNFGLSHKFDPPLRLAAGDSITMNYVMVDGVVRHERHVVLGGMMPDRETIVDEAVMFETEVRGRRAIGVMLLERQTGETANEQPTYIELQRYRR